VKASPLNPFSADGVPLARRFQRFIRKNETSGSPGLLFLRVGAGMGLIVCVLLPIVLAVFGVLDVVQTVSGILLLCGLWAIVYGIMFGKISDRLYDVGAGIIVIAISTFVFLPVQYVVGLVLISIIAIVLTAIAMPRKMRAP
jgi:hypothetical protein